MTAVILTLHTILVAALVGVVLLQRSEGGALGIGGGGGGGMMSGRGAANVLTRATTILGAAFFATSLLLAVMSDSGPTQDEVIRSITGETEAETAPEFGTTNSDDLIDLLDSGASTPSSVEQPSFDLPVADPVADEVEPAAGDAQESATVEKENENGN